MSAQSLYVELDVFSGRPNPGWPMTPAEALGLWAMLNRLLPTNPVEAPPGLGYRGFIVHRVLSGQPFPWLQVRGGVVKATDNYQLRYYRDTENIEGWLRRQAIGRGFGNLIGG